MKLSQLYYFNTICKHSNLTRAARELYISQPSLSNTVRELETELDVRLFQRLSKGIILTEEGILLQKHSELILSQVGELLAQMAELRQNKHPVHIGIPPMIGKILFPDIYQRFQVAYPDVNLTIEDVGSEISRNMIIDGKLNLAIVSSDSSDSKHFNRINLQKIQLLCYVGYGHPFASLPNITLSLLVHEKLAILQEDTFLFRFINKECKAIHKTPNILLKTNNFDIIRNMIINKNAISILYAGIFGKDDRTVGIPLEDPVFVNIDLIWNRNEHLNSGTSKFIEFIQEKYHENNIGHQK